MSEPRNDTNHPQDVIGIMREFNVEAHMPLPPNNPDPTSRALADMISEIHRLRTVRRGVPDMPDEAALRGDIAACVVAAISDDLIYGDDPGVDSHAEHVADYVIERVRQALTANAVQPEDCGQ